MKFRKFQTYVWIGRIGEWRCYLYGYDTLLAAFGREGKEIVTCPAWSNEANADPIIFAPLKKICVQRGLLNEEGFRQLQLRRRP